MECSITGEIIEKFGVTLCGQYYEYDAIREWLMDNDTDPNTNQVLPQKIIFTDLLDNENVEIFCRILAKGFSGFRNKKNDTRELLFLSNINLV